MNLFQIQHMIGSNNDINILFFLVVGDDRKAQVVLLPFTALGFFFFLNYILWL